MDFKKTNDPHLQNLRSAIANAVPGTLEQSEQEAIAFLYWEAEIRDCISHVNYEQGWHYIQLAALGKEAFNGPDRICRGHVEAQPDSLMCDPNGVTGLVHLLYHGMTSSKTLRPMNPFARVPEWGDLFPSGNRIAQLLYQQHNIIAFVAGLQALAIAEWANNYRRLSVAA